MPVYKCYQWKGQIKPNDKQKIKFFSKKELKKINIIEADLPLLEPLINLLK